MPPQKPIAFEYFAAGYRPSQIYDRVTVTKRVLYKYYQEYKRMMEGIQLEEEEENKDIELQLAAEEAEERAKQEAERLQQEANEKAVRQQQELKPLTDKLHSIEATISHHQWFPRSLPMDWLLFGNAYASPKEYQEALKKHRDALSIKVKEVKDRQVLTIGG